MKKILLILMTFFTVVIGYSQSFNAPDNNGNTLEYTIITSTTNIKVDAYVSGGTEVDIPLTVSYNGVTYNVTTIDFSAFTSKSLTSVIIPNSITTINGGAFQNNALTSVTIPSSVTSIGSIAFLNNPLNCVISEALTPPTIVTGTNDSFGTNRSNINLTIPSGTASAYAASQWTGFNSVAEGLTGAFVLNNISYEINSTSPNEVTITDYNTAGGTIVNIFTSVARGCTDFSVTAISDYAFYQKNLESVDIPDSIITIGEGAFAFNNLLSVTIPDTVTIIEGGTFGQNTSMTSVVVGNSVTSIGAAAFRFSGLTSVTIPDSVTSIDDYAFDDNNIANLVIGDGLTSIGDFAFRYNNMTSVTIPENVTSIGDAAFSFNSSLADVTSLATTPPSITTVSGVADTFNNNGIRSNIHLHIPVGSTGVYVTDAGALWTGFNPVTEDASLSTSNFELAYDIRIISSADNVEVMYSNSLELQDYSVYNMSGSKIKEGKENTININTLSNGIYILKLDFDQGTVVKKFAK
ncbi:leucine-rich repeat domain-containing protein [Algibacter sp.]|nr:leucine-rich repeat domain-containing protein [Algibacter sp.]